MNVLPYIGRDAQGTVSGRPLGGARFCGLPWTMAALCAALIVIPVTAQEKTEPKAGTQSGGSCGGGCGGGGEAPAAWSPQGSGEAGQQQLGPQWACEEPSLSIEPIWRGDQIACSWLIKNVGDDVLRIQAKGG